MTRVTPTSMSGHQQPYAGKSNEWLTPPDIIEALGPFDLDPCAPIKRPWPTAERHYTVEDDGLRQTWDGFVWVNPPYGPWTWKWLHKLAEHGNGIGLIFARTETQGFFAQAWERADSMLYLDGRLYFHCPDGTRAPHNAGAPSVLLGYGRLATERLAASGLQGALVTAWEMVG